MTNETSEIVVISVSVIAFIFICLGIRQAKKEIREENINEPENFFK